MTYPIVWSLSLTRVPVTLLVFPEFTSQISYFQLNPCLRSILVELKIRRPCGNVKHAVRYESGIQRRGSLNLWVVSRKMVIVPVIYCTKRDYPKISWLKTTTFFLFFFFCNLQFCGSEIQACQPGSSSVPHDIIWGQSFHGIQLPLQVKLWAEIGNRRYEWGWSPSSETSNSKRPASWGRASSREWALPALYAADKSTHIKNWHCEYLLGPRDIE